MKKTIRIGTRKSRLAVWQAQRVAYLLQKNSPEIDVEVVGVSTLGDRDKATSLVGLGQVGVFTKEIEDALLDGRCDIAVHSFKDLATSLPDGLTIGAILEREDPRDVLISRDGHDLSRLPPGARIGTSSLRRRALLLHLRPDLEIVDLRGNVPTRLRAAGAQIDEGNEPTGEPIDGTVMALAGLKRLGLDRYATETLDPDPFVPAPAQGAVAVEIRSDDEIAKILSALDHQETRLATTAERTFLRVMEGGCHIPLGAIATVEDDEIHLSGVVLSLDGKRVVRGDAGGGDPGEVGDLLARELLTGGAQEILSEVANHIADCRGGEKR